MADGFGCPVAPRPGLGEDAGVPIKRLHKMTELQAALELRAVGLELQVTEDFLPQQHRTGRVTGQLLDTPAGSVSSVLKRILNHTGHRYLQRFRQFVRRAAKVRRRAHRWRTALACHCGQLRRHAYT